MSVRKQIGPQRVHSTPTCTQCALIFPSSRISVSIWNASEKIMNWSFRELSWFLSSGVWPERSKSRATMVVIAAKCQCEGYKWMLCRWRAQHSFVPFTFTLPHFPPYIMGEKLPLNAGAKFQRWFIISLVKLQNCYGNVYRYNEQVKNSQFWA